MFTDYKSDFLENKDIGNSNGRTVSHKNLTVDTSKEANCLETVSFPSYKLVQFIDTQ